jgi:hypothetical protein
LLYSISCCWCCWVEPRCPITGARRYWTRIHFAGVCLIW